MDLLMVVATFFLVVDMVAVALSGQIISKITWALISRGRCRMTPTNTDGQAVDRAKTAPASEWGTLAQSGSIPICLVKEMLSEAEAEAKAESQREAGEGGERTHRPKQALSIKSLADYSTLTVPDWIVEDLVPASSGEPKVLTFTAESNTGKSFVGLDLSLCVAQGEGFHGKRTKKSGVLYFFIEADQVDLRLAALRQHIGLQPEQLLSTPVRFVQSPLTLASTQGRDGHSGVTTDVARFREAVAAVRAEFAAMDLDLSLIHIDTMRASMRGSENDDAAIADYVGVVRSALCEVAPNATVLIYHQTGWQDGKEAKKRERGSSVIRGNTEGAIFLERLGERDGRDQKLRLSLMKQRDGDTEGELLLVRRVVEVLDAAGNTLCNRWGKPVTSCIIVDDPTGKTSAQHKAADDESKLGVMCDRIVAAVEASPVPLTSAPEVRALVSGDTGLKVRAMSRLRSEGRLLGGNRKPFMTVERAA